MLPPTFAAFLAPDAKRCSTAPGLTLVPVARHIFDLKLLLTKGKSLLKKGHGFPFSMRRIIHKV